MSDTAGGFHRGDRAPTKTLQRPPIGFTEIDKDLVCAAIRDIVKFETADQITLYIDCHILRT